jgi:hypothetical protein
MSKKIRKCIITGNKAKYFKVLQDDVYIRSSRKHSLFLVWVALLSIV